MGDWDEAVEMMRLQKEAELICVHCGAANRPRVVYVHLSRYGLAICDVCSKEFAVSLGKDQQP